MPGGPEEWRPGLLARSRKDSWVGRLGRISGARDAEKAINSLGSPKGQKEDGVWRTAGECVARLCSGLKQERDPWEKEQQV